MKASPEFKALKIVYAIIRDLADRRGLRQAWDEIDEDVRQEIMAEWVKITLEEGVV